MQESWFDRVNLYKHHPHNGTKNEVRKYCLNISLSKSFMKNLPNSRSNFFFADFTCSYIIFQTYLGKQCFFSAYSYSYGERIYYLVNLFNVPCP